MVLDVLLDRFEQFGPVRRIVAGGGTAGTAQHTQGETHLQRIGIAGEVGDIDRLQVRGLDRGVQLRRVAILGLQAIGNGAAHGLLAQRHGQPASPTLSRIPGARTEQGIGRIELAFEGEYGGSGQFGLGHGDLLMR
ncbi:hypothetical protein D3C78_1520290 [compost metagenome]